MSHNYFRHKKHIGILNPDEPKKQISIEMPQKMNENDFQNVVYPCCGLMEIRKWGFNTIGATGEMLRPESLKRLLRNANDVGLFVGGLFNWYVTMKSIMGQQIFRFVHYAETHI